jgi:hypothetical protein
VTVFANPAPGECRELIGGRAVASTEPDRVVIAAFGIDRRADDCTRAGLAAPVTVTLAEPLAGRVLVDAVTGGPVPTYPERVLPVLPEPYREVPTSYAALTGERFPLSYTREDGADLTFMMARATGPAPSGSAAERIVVGGRAAVLSNKSYGWTLSWRADGIDVELRFGANEGVTLARGYVIQLINELGW